jgi:NTE family protein
VNRVLAAGERAFGGRFLRQLNGALAEDGAPPVVPVSLLHINASEDIGRLAADFVRSARFKARSHSLLERAFARLADGEAADEADLLSYVLLAGVTPNASATRSWGSSTGCPTPPPTCAARNRDRGDGGARRRAAWLRVARGRG